MQYFSELKSGKPQIFGLYWSKPQVEIRQSIELDKVKRWLNKLWKFKIFPYIMRRKSAKPEFIKYAPLYR